MFPDELQLFTELTEASNNAAAHPSRDVTKEAMFFGILTNKILPGATVLGFSRSGNYLNKELFYRKSEVYSLVDIGIKDIQEMVQKHAEDPEDPEKMKSVFNKIKQIGLNQILFVMKILEHQEEDFENIANASDLFLIILRGNLAFHNHQGDTGFSQILKGEDKNFVKEIFKLCKENLQNYPSGQGDKIRAGVFEGTLIDEENWESAVSGIQVSLKSLKSVGIFDIPSSVYETLTLTAQHLSFVEFFASVGIILSSDIKAELEKIHNKQRIRAVSVYIWNDLLKIKNLIVLYLILSKNVSNTKSTKLNCQQNILVSYYNILAAKVC